MPKLTLSNNFAIFLQYLKKEERDEVDFLYVDKLESFLQINTMIFIGVVKHSRSSQNSKSPISLQYLKKELREENIFLHVDKHQSFYNLKLLFLMDLTRHVQTTQSTSVVVQNIQIFDQGPVMVIATYF